MRNQYEKGWLSSFLMQMFDFGRYIYKLKISIHKCEKELFSFAINLEI
jgi:hypothetical protein